MPTIHRFLCCADTHDHLPPPLDLGGAVAWLHAGDVYYGANQQLFSRLATVTPDLRRWAEDRREAIRQWFDSCPVPVYAVRGNHDVADNWGFFGRSVDVTGRVQEIAPHLFLAGVGWHGRTASDLPGEGELKQVCGDVWRQAVRKLGSADRLILLTHYQARTRELPGFPGASHGFDCIRGLVDEFHPLAVVQGHVHEAAGFQGSLVWEGGGTLIINPGPQGGLLAVEVDEATATFAGR